MGLQQFERRLERLVEGMFAWAFRSGLQPVEIARRMTREMDLRRTIAPRGTIAPNNFTVVLSNEDRDRFEPIEEELVAELVEVANDHANAEGYLFLGPVNVGIEVDEDLPAGALLVTGEMVRPAGAKAAESVLPGPPAPPGRAAARLAESAAAAAGAVRAPSAGPGRVPQRRTNPPPAPMAVAPSEQTGYVLILPDENQVRLGSKALTIGRLPDCGIVLSDQNVSRYHAEIRPVDDRGNRGGGGGRRAWELADLGSTNGTKVNGVRLDAPRILQPGDRITLGVTTLSFEQEPGW